MRYPLFALTLIAAAHCASAEEGYTAKSLFFSEDDSVVAVSTSAKPRGDAPATALAAASAVDAPAPSAAVKVVKVTHHRHATPHLGAGYFIRLKESDGSTRDVLAKRVFHSGERFQLGVKVNHPSYVYILNEAPDGTVTQLYPQPSQDNFVDAMGVVFFPAKGSFQFDDKPGMEKLMVFLSPHRQHDDITQRIRAATPDLVSNPGPVAVAAAGACPATAAVTASAAPAAPDLAVAASAATATVAAATGNAASDATEPLQIASNTNDGYAAKGIAFAPDEPSPCAQAAAADASPGYAAKGIVFSDDAAPPAGGQVASYVVKPETHADTSLYLKINLAHE